ncbi:GT2 family glycosyltransferase [Rhodoblastus acidophilus]|uniref:glycosyltransferase family 2 protein n=1 Tax=Rhodoblastus acidophilus TaxID=1074 RepID=UPI002224E449|nr:glycosyltransferase family 2 protein [Rhodoblastus acidophilus]MCW2283842.1 GT2 family glycosyltransferase [Rhodoblastus acidophilus]MCW2332538.1 GT2 family glycosyltransferase [Rhodoblastus acidophilus]
MTTAVIIVAYRNPEDIRRCLRALRAADPGETFDICLVENGGAHAFAVLVALLAEEGLIFKAPRGSASPFARLVHFAGGPHGAAVWVGLAPENLGYAGGVNLWLRRLEPDRRVQGYWILNPDTQPEPGALSALIARAERGGYGMVASQLVSTAWPERVLMRGMRWRPLVCRPLALERSRPSRDKPSAQLATLLEAPSGASFYVTRVALQEIGPMEESYFLFYEDLEWGLRAKTLCGLALAEDSTVRHVVGATIGSAGARGKRSALAVYLDHRNRLHFVRRMFPDRLRWTALVVLARTFEFLAVGAFRNFEAALAGWAAGLRGETGRPERFYREPAE